MTSNERWKHLNRHQRTYRLLSRSRYSHHPRGGYSYEKTPERHFCRVPYLFVVYGWRTTPIQTHFPFVMFWDNFYNGEIRELKEGRLLHSRLYGPFGNHFRVTLKMVGEVQQLVQVRLVVHLTPTVPLLTRTHPTHWVKISLSSLKHQKDNNVNYTNG